mgnify:CR=1 FL=1
MVFHSLAHSASWFVGMGAVVESAVCGYAEYFLEVVAHFLAFHVECTESLDARRVDDVAVAHAVHRRECRGVLALMVALRYLACANLDLGSNGAY